MKTNLLSLLIIVAFVSISNFSMAQCNPAIPSTANVVNTSQTVNGGFTPQWICNGDTLYSNGGIFNVYIEPGGVMSTGGGIDSIWVKAGATLLMRGGIHTIILEPGSILIVTGGIPTYDTCSSININYSHAPSSGCSFSSVNNSLAGSLVSISPNPSSGKFSIECGEMKQGIEIYNILGEIILITKGNGKKFEIDLSSQQKGTYFVKITDENKNVINRKIVIL